MNQAQRDRDDERVAPRSPGGHLTERGDRKTPQGNRRRKVPVRRLSPRREAAFREELGLDE